MRRSGTSSADVEIETYGCAMNQADSEFMAGLLEKNGHTVGEGGEILIVNTCTVKTPTERKILKRLKELGNSGRRVIVTGCMPRAQPDIVKEFPRFSFIGTNIEDILEAVEQEKYLRISDGACRLEFPRRRKNPLVEIIPLAQGCVGDCSYCIVRSARGQLNSYDPELILADLRKALPDGVREFWLTAQDTGAYGKDIDSSLPELLKKVSAIEGDFRLRVGMMNPNHVLQFLDELIDAYRDERIYKFIHIPVQSGDDKVLKDMNRRYSADDFRRIVKEFRDAFPRITISTDVILGFPTETEEAFQNTLSLLEETEPEVLNISRFWLRPGTKAGEFKQLPTRISKDRSRMVNSLFKDYALRKNQAWIGWEGRALVSEESRGSYTARNFVYKPVIIKSDKNMLGQFVNVKITDATYYDLRCEA
ncbi:MAG: tRNA (N(6)-L-threonylcarbamoyladenosine(37)-C(2))-methylthiotransferase [Candidatus Altiarchaeales archaeon]|nr:tRNA (N(6)-L-threonylcarbamoyladenosine(37)-C(2))-methylthiotransferase [Candidatus Altiarchaeota archaeon]MBU4341087.1 tRNA (N(6)-L-threonylcarbamoyladenosine(37)-C(2))-methylthiotransferase [Candidatus Altiarchaeota archaeon]MBU4406400.1 tRNA (N(6)-L-threonylcarbamoyladenosine(37)-C(2))-methylthiotransferase [Candidatus Altiarchaeota archaeon]MBU4436925.1 tRNA (N(6)-L-threonylcarbamoyladenosine(37)-C(2))-methylthiotransferase [Candidatus Altiarchaeota archaeon]MCG2782271.1 tRNA (N(6)-L-thr